MKSLVKLFGGLVVGACAFVFALTLPGTGAAEAYTYNYGTNYTNYTSYQPVSYNYGNTSNVNYSNYTNYTNYTKPNYSTPSQPTTPVQQPTQTSPKPTQTNQSVGNVDRADEVAMLNKVNQERVAAGLKPLTEDPQLTKLAETKANDMIQNNYFSHTSPTYGSPFDMMHNAGITYNYAGENLAGAPDVNTAHTNLMNSPGHKANIMKPEYTKVGIGVVDGGPYGKMYVQEFNG